MCHEHTFFSLAAICLFLFTWLLAMLANFLATVRGRLIGMECLSAPSTGGTISMAVIHSSPACLVTILIFDHRELTLILAIEGLVVVVATGLGFVAACKENNVLSLVGRMTHGFKLWKTCAPHLKSIILYQRERTAAHGGFLVNI